jgi:hypothetical protein
MHRAPNVIQANIERYTRLLKMRDLDERTRYIVMKLLAEEVRKLPPKKGEGHMLATQALDASTREIGTQLRAEELHKLPPVTTAKVSWSSFGHFGRSIPIRIRRWAGLHRRKRPS